MCHCENKHEENYHSRGRQKSWRAGDRIRLEKTERKFVNVGRDLTLLKDPIRFISQLVNNRGIYEPDTMRRLSIDSGDNSTKMIVNVFDKHHDREINFTKREKEGNLCS